ncbi:hypothetical protein D3C80_837840 [compost metagenome]
MMNQNVKLWLRAANPFTPPRGMAEAQRAARTGAVALVIGALQGLASIPELPGKMAQSMDLVKQGAGASAEEQAIVEAMMGAMLPMMGIGVAVFSVLYMVLAVVQWRRMTWVIPVIMLVLLAYSLLGALNGLVMFGGKMAGLFTALAVAQWIIMLATAFIYVAAFRGGRMLEKLKRDY